MQAPSPSVNPDGTGRIDMGWKAVGHDLFEDPAAMTSPSRYDGLADWYDREIGGLAVTTTALEVLGRLVGAGPGTCLDLGCGTGIAIPGLLQRGWPVVGVDLQVTSFASPDNGPTRPAPSWSRPMRSPCRSPTDPSTRSSRC
jgi:hypothetical protein